MNVGDLVRRQFACDEERQRLINFGDKMDKCGIVVEIDERHGLCAVIFNGDNEKTILPMGATYLEVLSDSEEKGKQT